MTEHGASEADIRPIAIGESFAFSCTPERACFTECCRLLDLALSPYDVLRLKRALAISSGAFLDQYAVIEEGGNFPVVYLGMVDDGRASCPFVCEEGCRVYGDRPAACRFYPIGRGASMTPEGCRQQFVLVREPHCLGHERSTPQDIDSWQQGQELAPYIRAGDRFAGLVQHPAAVGNFTADREQRQLYLTCLYDLDGLRRRLIDGDPSLTALAAAGVPADDETLLDAAIDWLAATLFPDRPE